MALHLVVLCYHLWVLLVFTFGFALLLLFFFAEITVANGYWWIWLWVHNREKRKIEVLGFREFGYGFTISISPQPYQTPDFSKFFSKSSLYVGKASFFFFFWVLTHTHYSIFSLCLVCKKIEGKKNIGYCSLCCLSFILRCKCWNFWFVFGWEGERNSRFVIYVVQVLVKMRDLLKVEPNGCLRLRLKSLISFIVIWLLRKFERTWECGKNKLWV